MGRPKGKKVAGAGTIYTDNKWKQFKYRDEVPKTVLANQFDYLAAAAFDGFFKYKNVWYHVSEFIRSGAIAGWDGYVADSFSSGVLIKLSDDGEEYKVATYIA